VLLRYGFRYLTLERIHEEAMGINQASSATTASVRMDFFSLKRLTTMFDEMLPGSEAARLSMPSPVSSGSR
jgi:hypothetical protein